MNNLTRPWLRPWMVSVDGDTDPGGTSQAPTDSGEGDDEAQHPTPGERPKPTETVEYWRTRARENERRAKANADAAAKLQEIEDAKKSDTQKAADELARARQETADAVADSIRYRAAAKHGVTGDDINLLGRGDEAEVEARAERLGALLRAEREAATPPPPPPTSPRPVPNLRAGATPADEPGVASPDDIAHAAAVRRGVVNPKTQ